MTSAPWMKDVLIPVADPIPPVSPEDDRPSVKDLITEHREKIDKIKAGLEDDPLFDYESKHDDLWILRFFLSNKKTKTAIKAAKYTLEFRNNYMLDDKDIRDLPPHKVLEGNVHEYWQKRFQGDSVVCTVPDKRRGVIIFLNAASMNPDAAKTLSDEAWMQAYMYTNEWCFQWLDHLTRTTGRLTKAVRFITMKGIEMSSIMDRASSKRDAKVAEEMEDCYPQLVQTIFMIEPPSFVHLLWSFFRPIVPKRIMDKVDLITPKTNESERQRLFKHISIENLPEDMGGCTVAKPVDWKIE